MDAKEYIYAVRSFLAAEYLHHKRMTTICAQQQGRDYHSRLMRRARASLLDAIGRA